MKGEPNGPSFVEESAVDDQWAWKLSIDNPDLEHASGDVLWVTDNVHDDYENPDGPYELTIVSWRTE